MKQLLSNRHTGYQTDGTMLYTLTETQKLRRKNIVKELLQGLAVWHGFAGKL